MVLIDRMTPTTFSSQVKSLKKLGVLFIPALILGSLLIIVIFANQLAPYDPYKMSTAGRLLPALSQGHLLGTDELGRDILSRLIFGARTSLMLGVTPVLLALIIGGALGLLAGYFGGRINAVIMRCTDTLYAFPSVLLAVAIAGPLGGGVKNTLIALTMVFIPPILRVSESSATAIRRLDYVQAATISSAKHLTVIWVHVLPNCLATILVYASSQIGISIILASGLAFLGLGVPPPVPEWGLMLNSLRQSIYTAPYLSLLPGLMIFLTAIAFNLLSDGIRATMDKRK